MAVHSGDRLNRAERRTVSLSYRPFAFPLSSEEDARTKDKDIDQNQDNAQTEQNPVRFFRKMEQEQIFLRRKGFHGTGEQESPEERNPHEIEEQESAGTEMSHLYSGAQECCNGIGAHRSHHGRGAERRQWRMKRCGSVVS